MDFASVHPQFGRALSEGVNGFVFLEPIAFELEALGKLFDLRAEHEIQVTLTQVSFALRAMHRLICLGFNEIADELPLAGGTFKDFGKHGG